MIVSCATDNTTRTVANVRHHFKKGNGVLGNSGSVSFNFEHKAFFKLKKGSVADPEELELDLIDFGLDELDSDDDFIYIYCPYEEFGKMQKALEDRNVEVESAELQYIPNVYKELEGEQRTEMTELLDLLEEDDDVVAVYHNMQ